MLTDDQTAAVDDFIARSREASSKVQAFAEFLPELREIDAGRVLRLGIALDEMNAAMNGLTRAGAPMGRCDARAPWNYRPPTGEFARC